MEYGFGRTRISGQRRDALESDWVSEGGVWEGGRIFATVGILGLDLGGMGGLGPGNLRFIRGPGS